VGRSLLSGVVVIGATLADGLETGVDLPG